MFFLQRLFVYICALNLITWSVGMPPRRAQDRSANDLTQFVNSLTGFVGEVSGMLSRPEHAGFAHLSMTGFGYLDSLNIMSNQLLIFLNDHEAAQITNIQEALRALVNLLEMAGDDYGDLDVIQMDHTANHDLMIIPRPVGRQRIPVSLAQIEMLHGMGFTWVQMADVLGVSVRTLRNRRHEFNMPFGNAIYNNMTDHEINNTITNILTISPGAGQSMILGALRHRGLHLPRHRVRDSILRVNPVATALRRRYHISRRRYNVGQPNALWHVDGNHKLILWRLVIHGGIDGFSRTVVFLQCVNNNRADTVLHGFISAIRLFGLPQRLRVDYGTENFAIARYMLEERGLGRSSVITGRSVHNQRIERLWRDVNYAVLSGFRRTFFYMENSGLLNRDSELHIFALHFVYIPRINRALQHFVEAWNNHRLRTAGQSPLQLFYSSVLVQDVNIDYGNLEMYGVDEAGVPGEMQTNNHVYVPAVNFNISEANMVHLNTIVDVLANDNNNGINIFLDVINFLSTIH